MSARGKEMTRIEFWQGKGTRQERIEFIKDFGAPCCLKAGNQGQCNHLGGVFDGKRIREALIKAETA